MRSDSRLVASSEPRTAGEEIRQLRRSRHHVFDIIEQQQHLPIMEKVREAIGGRLFIQLEKTKDWAMVGITSSGS